MMTGWMEWTVRWGAGVPTGPEGEQAVLYCDLKNRSCPGYCPTLPHKHTCTHAHVQPGRNRNFHPYSRSSKNNTTKCPIHFFSIGEERCQRNEWMMLSKERRVKGCQKSAMRHYLPCTKVGFGRCCFAVNSFIKYRLSIREMTFFNMST